MIDWNDNAKAAVQAYDDWAGNESSMYVSYMDEFMQKIKQTKTVADAVADHDGKWPYSGGCIFMAFMGDVGEYFAHGPHYDYKKWHYLVCTRAEFEAYVKEQEGKKWTHRDIHGDECRIVAVNGEMAWIAHKGGYEDRITETKWLKPIKPTISEDAVSKLRAYASWTAGQESGYVSELIEEFIATHDII